MPMVTWQTTVRLAFEIAESKGADIDSLEDGGQLMSELSDYWSMHGDTLKQLTEEQARQHLRGVIDA